jgi:hypothetical protein
MNTLSSGRDGEASGHVGDGLTERRQADHSLRRRASRFVQTPQWLW